MGRIVKWILSIVIISSLLIVSCGKGEETSQQAQLAQFQQRLTELEQRLNSLEQEVNELRSEVSQIPTPVPRTATLVVAASDSSDKSKLGADYVCDGVDDQIEIQAAIDTLPANGGKVLLLEGQFNLSAPIKITKSPLVLEGMGTGIHLGAGVTTLKLADAANCNVIENADTTKRTVSFRHFTIDGNKANNASGHGINIDYLYIGNHYKAGIFDIDIHHCKEDGIHSTDTDWPNNYLSASHFVSLSNDGYGIILYSQGCVIQPPNWFAGNGKTGLAIMKGGDYFIDAYCESNREHGAHLTGDQSIYRLWTGGNGYNGVNLGCSQSIIEVYARDNAGADSPNIYERVEVMISDCSYSTIILNISPLNQTLAIDGLLFYNYNCKGNTIRGVINAKGYAVNFADREADMSATDTVISDCYLHGELGAFKNDDIPIGVRVEGNTGYADEMKSEMP